MTNFSKKRKDYFRKTCNPNYTWLIVPQAMLMEISQ